MNDSEGTAVNPISGAWADLVSTRGKEPAVYSATGETLRTFSDLERESRDLAAKLETFPPETVLAVQIGNAPQWPALFLAALRAKLIVLPLGQQIEIAERDAALRTCGATALATRAHEQIEIVPLDNPRPVWNGARVPEFLKLTSGTTAAPRAIRFQCDQLVADCENICDTMGIRADDINFGVIPFSHSYGFSNLITPLLCRGVRLVVSEDRMPRAILDGLNRSAATVFPGMPVFFEKLAELENAPRLDRLRLCISAGAPLPGCVAEKFARQFRAKIHTFYGASECGGICYDRGGDAGSAAGFVGSAMDGVSIGLLQSAPPSRIEVRSRAVGDGYFPQTDPASLGDGRFVPGDLIERSGAGYRIAGRVSDVINVAGRKLNPHEVEAQLMRFPGVRQAVVFGVSSSLRNEEAVACVVADGAGSDDLIRFCRASLSAWQVPKAIWLVAEIPTSERGKISRRELVEKYRLSQRTTLGLSS